MPYAAANKLADHGSANDDEGVYDNYGHDILDLPPVLRLSGTEGMCSEQGLRIIDVSDYATKKKAAVMPAMPTPHVVRTKELMRSTNFPK